MKILAYLKDTWPYFCCWLLFTAITVLILLLTPSVKMNRSAITYIILIQGLCFLIILIYRYLKRLKWWRELEITKTDQLGEHHLSEAITEEDHLVQHFINHLLEEQKRQTDQLIQDQEEQRDFIDSWVHEIKVPLQAMRLLLESIEEDIPEKTYYTLENEQQKIDGYVEQVLYFSRLDSFARDYFIQEYSLMQITQKVVRTYANYFIQKNLHVHFEGSDRLVLTDQKWLIFILTQILSNSIKYTPTGGDITCEIKENEQGVWLLMQDNGVGIPSEDLRRIFDKGFTGKNGRNDQQKATGLGLYLAKSLAEKLGHRIYVESQIGKGTQIQILFPHLTFYNEESAGRLI